MRFRRLSMFAFASVAVLLSGCETTRTIAVAPSAAPNAIYEGGVPILKSVKGNVVVVRLLSSQFTKEVNGLPALYVSVANRSGEAIDFSPANITAFSGDKPVKVYTAEELQKRIQHEANMMAFAMAMNSASRSMQAAMPTQTYSTGTVNAYGSGGYATGNYSGTSTTYNPAATAAAQAQINADTGRQMAMVAAARDAQLSGTSGMLRRETIAPGAYAGGAVRLHVEGIQDGRPLKVLVSVPGEVHEFLFETSH